MTNEIKEDDTSYLIDCLKSHKINFDYCLNELLDYITNLQEENERLKTTQIFIDTQDPEERCGQALYEEMVKRDCENYKQRIDKAVEYIENDIDLTGINGFEKLLDILRGDE